jgi:hypothetical protein
MSTTGSTTALLVPAGSTNDYTPSTTCLEVIASIDATASSFIRWGHGTGVTTGTGHPILQGEKVEIHSRAPIRFANPGASGVVVSISENDQ